jgi:hypothetical protein
MKSDAVLRPPPHIDRTGNAAAAVPKTPHHSAADGGRVVQVRPRHRPKGGYLFLSRRLTRSGFLKWLRRTHAWFGLWGAVFGLLFGVSGFLLNHRTVLKIPAAHMHESTLQLLLPTLVPDSAQGLAAVLQQELRVDQEPQIRVEKDRPVPWGEKNIRQPERWQIHFATPTVMIQAEYWVGNTSVSVKRMEANFFAFLTRLHKGAGVGPRRR